MVRLGVIVRFIKWIKYRAHLAHMVLVHAGKAPLAAVHVKHLIEGMPHKPTDDSPEVLKLMFEAFLKGDDHGSIFEAFNTHMKDIVADMNLSVYARRVLLGYLPSVYLRLVAGLINSNKNDAESYDDVSW